MQKLKPSTQVTSSKYGRILEIDGTHDFREHVPHGYVLYPVRELQKGKILYFNFALAKEMELIDQNHPEIINKELEEVLLKTFSVQIINEFDQQKYKKWPKKWCVKNNRYMATRYLQIQHKSKSGKTSGDGRSIWLGQVTNKNEIWDVSARGTGVTCLSPAYSQTDKPLKSGNTEFGYGCGTVDLDELIGTCIQSEIFHSQGINTERTLIIIKTGAKIGIGVRAGKNLFRPAHLFLNLKQKNVKRLQTAMTYFKDRVAVNHKSLKNTTAKSNRFYIWLVKEMAQFTAILERSYIFLWMEWDGDNILLEPGVIDYGSIRQFGSYHNEYRYDDITSWSTSLTEQKNKAKHICKMFVQTMLTLNTSKPVPISKTSKHPLIEIFEKEYSNHQLKIFFSLIGFDIDSFHLLKISQKLRLRDLFLKFHKLEKIKASNRYYDTGDGKNKLPKFDMRKFLNTHSKTLFFDDIFISTTETIYFEQFLNPDSKVGLTAKDIKLWRSFIKDFNVLLQDLLKTFNVKQPLWQKTVEQRNPLNRMTGNAIIMTVDRLMRIKDPSQLTELINAIVKQQANLASSVILKSPANQAEFQKINDLIQRYRTDI